MINFNVTLFVLTTTVFLRLSVYGMHSSIAACDARCLLNYVKLVVNNNTMLIMMIHCLSKDK